MEITVAFNKVDYKIGTTTILNNISLDIKAGEITGFLGLNGAGKSTLLSLINGLRNQTSGKITLLGTELPSDDGRLRSKIGVVFQETALYEELTTFENLEFAAALYNLENTKERITEVLELLKLMDRKNQIVKTLSGGLKRRVAIARGFLHDPQLLIIDEPTLGVDVEARHAIWSHLRLLKSQGRTIIVATNYLDEAQALCDMVAVLHKGRLLTTASPDYLVSRAGYCLDVECDAEAGEKFIDILSGKKGVLRADTTPSGLSIFLKDRTLKKQMLDIIVGTGKINGFRFRSADLAEVFKSLQEKNDHVS